MLVYFIAVILWGALVRATGSGAGCGDHWPLCNGTVMQHSPRVDTIIEFTHRITSGLSLLFRRRSAGVDLRRHSARTSGARRRCRDLSSSRCIEAVLGALLVKLGLTAQSHSPCALLLALHLTNTLLLLAALTLTAHFLSREQGYLREAMSGSSRPSALSLGILVLLVVGVTGSLAALGDTLFPGSLA